MPEWINVKDRIPPYGEPVLVARVGINNKLRVEQGQKESGDWWKVYGTLVKRVRYWMPMPEPPKEEDDG